MKEREDNERGGSDYLRKAIILNINFLLKGVYYSKEAINWRMDIIQGNRVYGICSELVRASRAPWVSKSTHPRKFGNH